MNESLLKTPLPAEGRRRKCKRALQYIYLRVFWHTYMRIALHTHGSTLTNFGKVSFARPKIIGCGAAILKVGKYCSISNSATFILGLEHNSKWLTTCPFSVVDKNYRKYPYPTRSKGDINVGNDVWIGYEALILSGVKIGDGAIIGARSVVAKDVPPYAIVAGNPSKIIRYRFSPEVIEQLLELKWWDKPDEWISQNMVFTYYPKTLKICWHIPANTIGKSLKAKNLQNLSTSLQCRHPSNQNKSLVKKPCPARRLCNIIRQH